MCPSLVPEFTWGAEFSLERTKQVLCCEKQDAEKFSVLLSGYATGSFHMKCGSALKIKVMAAASLPQLSLFYLSHACINSPFPNWKGSTVLLTAHFGQLPSARVTINTLWNEQSHWQ